MIGFVFFCWGRTEAGVVPTQPTASEMTESLTASSHQDVAPEQRARGTIYRSDGFRPGVASEFIQVAYNDDFDRIVGIWYWNNRDQNKIRLEIVNQEVITGDEISGAAGDLRFPGDSEVYGFGIVEGIFALTDSNDRRQEFDYEDFEE